MEPNNYIEDKDVHVFDNGIKVFKRHLIPLQIERYKKNNLHEPEEEEWFSKIILKLKHIKDPFFVDIGAAIGYYSILMRKNLPSCRILCYEPLELHRKYFFENWELNKLKKINVEVINKAIYSKKATLLFKHQLFGSHIVERKKKIFSGLKEKFNTEKIQAETLDSELLHNPISISLLKIDVQGAEVDVLKGATSLLLEKKIKCLIIGTHSATIHKDCLAILRENNYSIPFEEIDTQMQPDGIIIATTKDFSLV